MNQDELEQLVREIARREALKIWRQQREREKRRLRELHDLDLEEEDD